MAPSTSLYQQNHWTNNAEQGYHSQLLHAVGPHADVWHFHGEFNNVAGEPKFSKTRTYTSRSGSFHRGGTMWRVPTSDAPFYKDPCELSPRQLAARCCRSCFATASTTLCHAAAACSQSDMLFIKFLLKKYRHRPVCSVTV